MNTLFHGTPNNYTVAGVSSYDRIWWTATHSVIAQTYIPASRGYVDLHVYPEEMSKRVIPCKPGVCPLWDIATMIQPELLNETRAQYDTRGHAVSYSISDAHPKVADICLAIENIFGYVADPDGRSAVRKYRLRIERIDDLGRSLYAASSWKLPGFLWIIQPPHDLKFYDMTGESSGDLTDPHYHHIHRFIALHEAGYDGVIIDDFAQSPTWGDVAHISYGFFAHAIPKLVSTRIPAKNFDWGPDSADFLGSVISPEYALWLSSQRKAA